LLYEKMLSQENMRPTLADRNHLQHAQMQHGIGFESQEQSESPKSVCVLTYNRAIRWSQIDVL